MLKIFKKKNKNIITAPVVGRSIPLENVADNVFAKRLIGDGIAFEFSGDTIYSPCSGDIIMIADTKHAFAIRTDNGTEVLLHVGLDTVSLNGEGMKLLVSNKDKVKAKTPILKIDRKIMKEKNIDLTMPLIIANTKEYNLDIKKPQEVNLDTLVIETKQK